MRSDRRLETFVATLGLWATVTGAVAAPAKPEASRKGFDYRRPNPGEMLPNPADGSGVPPRLKEFSPSGAMGDATHAGPSPGPPDATVPSDPGSLPPPAEAATPASQVGRPAAGVATVPPPPPLPAAPPPADRLQSLLAAEITRVGIDGITAILPPGAAPADPAMRPVMQHAWETLAGSLVASRAAWNSRFPDRSPLASREIEASVAPGRLIILAAPARVTGAFAATP